MHHVSQLMVLKYQVTIAVHYTLDLNTSIDRHMKTHFKLNGLHRSSIAGLCLMLFAFTACDSSNALMENDTVAATSGVSTLADNLQLTANQTEKVNEIIAKRGENEPGTLWYLAAELQETMTTEQKTALFEKIETARENRTANRGDGDGDGVQRRRGLRGNRARGGESRAFGNIDGLTDEQQEALQTLREAQREKIQALREQRKEGELDSEAFKTALQTVREEAEAELATILTDEQLAALEEARADREGKTKGRRGDAEGRQERFGEVREAAAAARQEALGLTDAQREQIEALRETQKEAGATLRESIRESGDMEAAREQLAAFRQESAEAMKEILTAEQQEIITIQKALAYSVAKNRSGESSGRRGNRRFNTFR